MDRGPEATATATAERPPERPAERPARRAAPPKQPRRVRVGVVTDPVGDMLTRIRNAARARHETVAMPASKLKTEIARILKAEGFIGGYETAPRTLTVRLKYVDGKISAITDVSRVSRPGLRVYAERRNLPRVRRGLGVTIVSTSRGVMTGSEAAQKGLGGEVLCTVW